MHFPNSRMSTHLPACRLFSLCALIMACAALVGGCAAPQPGPQGGAGPFDSPTPAEAAAQHAPQAGTEPQPPGGQAGAPGWNLEALAALQPGNTLSLQHAWYLALEHDPEYLAALSGRAAAQTEIRQGRAGLLPQLSAGYSRSKVTGLQRNYPATGPMRESDLDYDSTSAYIQLRQPLFNIDRYATYQGGKERARLGEAEFALRQYEAALRLVDAFLESVAAQGSHALAQALAASLAEQAAAQQALYERNEGDRVDAQETRARLALAEAEVIAAEDALQVARRSLQALIGRQPPPLAGVDTLSLPPPDPANTLISWLERAETHNAHIRMADAETRVAETEVRRATARHLPTADLVVAWVDADSENLDSLSQRSNTFQVGVQMAIPLFSGGFDTANHARSRHERRQAEQTLRLTREQAAAEVTRQYSAVVSGRERIAALQSAVASGEASLEAARYGYQYGQNSNVDVLRRQDSLFQARYELLQARVAWLQARIALAAAAGEPPAALFAQLDALFAAPPAPPLDNKNNR